MSCLEQQLINCHDILEPSVPGLQSRSGKGGNTKGWTNFQSSAQKNVRGRLIRRDTINISPSVEDPSGEAMSKCRKKCADRPSCCMTCAKPRGNTNRWLCYMYDGRFGGKSEEAIEKVSDRRGDEVCAYKNEHSSDIGCMAQ